MRTSIPMKKLLLIASGMTLSTCVLAVDRASAQILLDFEGLGDTEQVLEFYNGGTGSSGISSGTNYGVSFLPGAQASISVSAGGTGDFINEPSPDTAALFLTGPGSLVMNVAAGFTTGFSFFYTADASFPPTSVRVYDALGGAAGGGNILATISLPNNAFDNNCGPIGSTFCNWDAVGASFSGTAFSVDFSNAANEVAFDNITIGRDTPCLNQAQCGQVQVPEPTSVMGLLAVSALGAGSVLRRKLLK